MQSGDSLYISDIITSYEDDEIKIIIPKKFITRFKIG
jgi:hypothetical protein